MILFFQPFLSQVEIKQLQKKRFQEFLRSYQWHLELFLDYKQDFFQITSYLQAKEALNPMAIFTDFSMFKTKIVVLASKS